MSETIIYEPDCGIRKYEEIERELIKNLNRLSKRRLNYQSSFLQASKSWS